MVVPIEIPDSGGGRSVTSRIAVEDGLENVKQALRKAGFSVTKLTQGQMSNVDAAVLTGMSENFLGVHDTQGNKFPVVSASGLTAAEVVDTIQSRLNTGDR